MCITLVRAVQSDADAIFKVQVEAFMPLLDKYQDFDTNPANEKIEKLIMRINFHNGGFYKIMEHDMLVGGIRVYWTEEGKFWISPLFVSPQDQGRGIAQQAMLLVEKLYPQVLTWELATVAEEVRNCRLYEKMGFVKTSVEKPLNEHATLVFYKKTS